MSDEAYARENGQEEEDPHHDTVDFLYNMGAKYKSYLGKLREEYAAKEMEEVTGRPVITEYAQSLRRREDFSQRMQKDIDARRAKEEEKRASLAKKEAEEVAQHHPHISSHAQQLIHRAPMADSIAKFQAQHNVHLEELRQDALKRELLEVQPGPRIVPYNTMDEDRRHGLSIQDHLLAAEQQRQRRMYERVEEEMRKTRQNAKPLITKRARGVTPAKGGQTASSAAERLHSQAHRATPAYDEEFIEHCTFAPRTNHTIGNKVFVDPLGHLPIPERMQRRGEIHPHTARHEARSEGDHIDRGGAPQISDKSRQLVEQRREMLRQRGQFESSPGARLHNEAINKQMSEIANPAQRSGEDFTGQPLLSERSRQLDSSAHRTERNRRSFWEAKQKEAKKRLAELRQESAAHEVEQCTFRPNLHEVRKETAKVGHGHGHFKSHTPRKRMAAAEVSVVDRCLTWGKTCETRKKNLAEARKREREALEGVGENHEGQPLTFTPQIHHEIPHVVAPHQATGFESHTARMKRARELREPKPHKHTPRVTVPHEFSFSQRESTKIQALRPPVERLDLEDQFANGNLTAALPPHLEPANEAGYESTPFFGARHDENDATVDAILFNHQRFVHGQERRRI